MLVSYTRKVLCANHKLRHAMMIDELISTTSHQCYPGNKYLLHAYFSSIQPCVGCLMAWRSLFAYFVFLATKKWNLYIANMSKLRQVHIMGILYIYDHAHDSPIPYMSTNQSYCLNTSISSHVQYWWICNKNIGILCCDTFSFLKTSQLSYFPLLIFMMNLMCLWVKSINLQ